jgi:hypothetical protein
VYQVEIGFGEDAEVGAEVRRKSGSLSRRVIVQGAERAGGREGKSCSGLGTGWPKDAVEKEAELSAWIKSAWYETVSVIEDGSGNLTSGYVGATAADKLLVFTGRVGRRVKNGGHRDGGKVKEEVGNGEGSGTVHEEHQNGGIRKVQYYLYPDLPFCLSISFICFRD